MKNVLKSVMGVDVSKDKLDVCIIEVDYQFQQKILCTRSFPNTHQGIHDLKNYWFEKTNNLTEDVVVMEPTGTYHESLAYMLYDKNINVCIELANKINHFGKSLNIKTKTDKKDSVIIAKYGAQNAVKCWQPCSKNEMHLKHLTRLRYAVKKSIISAKNRLHAFEYSHEVDPMTIKFIEEEISFHEGQIEQLEKQIKRIIESDEVLSRKIKYLMSIPGVGFITSALVIAETGGFQTFHNIKNLVSYAGLDVMHKESGNSSKKPQISKRGNERLRTGLFMSGLSASHKAESLIPLYERIAKNTLVKKKGTIAVMRKTLILMYTLWKKEEMYNPKHNWDS